MEKKINYEDYFVWQDREVRFDIPKNQLCMRPGEKTFETIPNIEDTKGNNGDVGTLIFTNLRMVWYSKDNIKINLSIGYDCLLSYDVRVISSKIAGETRAICIKCKFNNNRFEFLFNAIGNNSPNLFAIFDNVFKSYDATRLYRDVKMKGFLSSDKNVNFMSKEKQLGKFNMLHIAADNQTTAGIYVGTNVRFIWYNSNATSESNNISIPWIHVKEMRVKDNSKHGKVMSIEGNKFVGNSVFNFKVDNLETVFKDIETAYLKFLKEPIFGCDLNNFESSISVPTKVENKPEVKQPDKPSVVVSNPSTTIIPKKEKPITKVPDEKTIEKQTEQVNKVIQSMKEEDVEFVDDNYFNEQSNILYYLTSATDKKPNMSDIVYSQELGMAIEKLPDSVNLENLWKIIIT